MNPQIIALAGALIGALTTLLGSLISHLLTMQREQKQWERQQQENKERQQRALKEETYEKAMRYILRARNKRSTLTAKGDMILDSQYVKEWVDDLIESQLALDRLATISDRSQYAAFDHMSYSLKKAIDQFLKIPVVPIEAAGISSFEAPTTVRFFEHADSLLATLDEIHQLLMQSASIDLKQL